MEELLRVGTWERERGGCWFEGGDWEKGDASRAG